MIIALEYLIFARRFLMVTGQSYIIATRTMMIALECFKTPISILRLSAMPELLVFESEFERWM